MANDQMMDSVRRGSGIRRDKLAAEQESENN